MKDDRAPIGDKLNKDILEFAVCIGSKLDGKQIKDVNWPSRCLLVAVRRVKTEITPKGDTVICLETILLS